MRDLHEGVMSGIRDELNQVLATFRDDTYEAIDS